MIIVKVLNYFDLLTHIVLLNSVRRFASGCASVAISFLQPRQRPLFFVTYFFVAEFFVSELFGSRFPIFFVFWYFELFSEIA